MAARVWLRELSLRGLAADFKAALSVALLDLPQSMAYAAVAGLPLQLGPMSSAAAGLCGAPLSTSRCLIMGPTNATAFMLFSYFAIHPGLDRVAMLSALVLMVGALQILGGLLRVAEMAQLISRTVVVAYITGASLLIMANQLPTVLGLELPATPEALMQRRTLPGMIWALLQNLGQISWSALAMASLAALSLLGLRRLRPRWPQLVLSLLLCSAVAALLIHQGIAVETYRAASFTLQDLVPDFSRLFSSRFFGDCSQLFGLAVALAFLSTLENHSMSKTLAARHGQSVNGNQDLLALGMANLGCAAMGAMPASGSLTRSALNEASGAQSPLACWINGLLCLGGVMALGPWVAHLPKAALAMSILLVAAGLIHGRQIRLCLTATGSDALVFAVTLLATLLLPLHVAIFTGVGLSIMLYLRKASRPSLVEYEFNERGDLAAAPEGAARHHPALSIVHVEGELFFGAADLFRTQVMQCCADPHLQVIILRLKNARHLDATCAMALEELHQQLRMQGRWLLISGVTKDVYRVLRDCGLLDTLGREQVFPASPGNPNVATRKALRRAQGLLGTEEPQVKIFFNPGRSASLH